MPQIADFVRTRASHITPKVVKHVMSQLPLLKAEFASINAPKFPHLVDQLEFLADVVEDFAEGATDEIPYVVMAEATFALIYTHKIVDLIPEFVSPGNLGHADDSSVVRSVLILHEKFFADYADKLGFDWDKISIKP